MNKWKTKNGVQIDQLLGGRSNAYLVSSNHKYFLIDTSTKASWHRLKKMLRNTIPRAGSWVALILTHVHFDHCENASSIKDDFGARVFVHESEASFLSSGNNALCRGALPVTRWLFNLVRGEKLFPLIKYAPCACDVAVGELCQVKDPDFNAYILHTPGHTVGSMSMIVDDEIALVGDTLFGVFPNSIFPPWAEDPKTMIKSWKKLLDTGCDLFLPGHGTPVGRDRVQKQYYQYRD